MKSLVRRMRTLAKIAVGNEPYFRPDIRVETRRFGSDYGGWDIVASSIDAHSVVYSFGIGEDASFDMAMIDGFGLTVHGFDPTPKSIEWVKRQSFPSRFVMHAYGIASFDGTASFNPPVNPDHVSHTLLDRPSTKANAITVEVRRLGTIMKELGHDKVDIMKMDIEGAEYDVISDMSSSGIRPRQVLIEFHHRFPNVGADKTRQAVQTLRSMGYRLFSISPANRDFGFILP